VAIQYDLCLTKAPQQGAYDAVVFAVKHDEFIKAGREALHSYTKDNGVFYDLKEVW